jgi:hypothetical protein
VYLQGQVTPRRQAAFAARLNVILFSPSVAAPDIPAILEDNGQFRRIIR